MAEKIPYSQQLEKIAEADGDVLVVDEAVPSGEYLFVECIGCRDLDSAPDKIIVGRGPPNTLKHLWEEEPSPAVDVLYHSERTHHVPDGQAAMALFEGCTAGDHLEVFIEGYLTAKPRKK